MEGTHETRHRLSAVRREGERVTPLELFFDLVFVLAITQCTALIVAEPTWASVAQGLAILALLWWSWGGYAWLTSVVNPEEGVVRIVMFAAMAAFLVAALCVPEAFDSSALFFACAYGVVRAAHITLFLIASREDPSLRRSVNGLAGSTALGVGLLFAAAAFDGAAQAAIWALALLLDFGGPFLFGVEGWKLVPGHFAERHGLIVIIALGESLVAIGVGVSEFSLSVAVVTSVLLGISITVGLWWAYFDVVAPVAERVLERTQGVARAHLARDSYTYLHLPMVVGIVFLALGLKKVVGYVSDSTEHELSDPLTGMPLVALYGGVALYLLALVAFRLRNVRSLNAQRLAVAALLLVLVPVAWQLPALLSLAVVAALVVGLIGYEATHFAEARAAIRHDASDGGLIPPEQPARP
ncbi:MAG: low temperature requirement protein A [Solirubrobacterales bacterium]